MHHDSPGKIYNFIDFETYLTPKQSYLAIKAENKVPVTHNTCFNIQCQTFKYT